MRAIPLWLLRAYLEELGGQVQADGSVAGEGWQARLTQLPDAEVGSLRIGQVRLELRSHGYCEKRVLKPF